MSRKTRRNQPSPASPLPPAQAAPSSSPMGRRKLFIASAVALLVVFLAAALWYGNEQNRSSRLAAAKNQPALSSAHSPTFGPAEAKVHIVEFLDPACETCASFFPHVKALMSANPGKIRLSIRHVPFHKGSDLVVRILEASRAQDKYLPTLEAFYAAQRFWTVQHQVQADRVWQTVSTMALNLDRLRVDMNAPDIARRMEQDMSDARVLGVTQTPEFFVNGRPLPSFGLEQLQDLVGEELRRAYP